MAATTTGTGTAGTGADMRRGRGGRRHDPAPLGAAAVAAAASAALVTFGGRARDRVLHWGATEEEVRASLPGDTLLDHADLTATRAVTVRTGPEDVWPWIAQLGQGRGGLYSYDAVENLIGCDMHSADEIVPEWQSVEVGDQLRLHPDLPLTVAAVDRGRSLVVRGGVPIGRTPPPYDFTWAFVLRDAPGGWTRLVVRERYGYTRWWSPLLVEPVSVASLVMSRRMLLGIRDRAERTAGAVAS